MNIIATTMTETCIWIWQKYHVDISNNCLDGYLYDFEGEKRLYHIDIVTEKLPYIYNRGQRISFSSLHQGDEVMIYTNWQTTETGYAGGHCNGFNLSWVKQIELLKCPHITWYWYIEVKNGKRRITPWIPYLPKPCHN